MVQIYWALTQKRIVLLFCGLANTTVGQEPAVLILIILPFGGHSHHPQKQPSKENDMTIPNSKLTSIVERVERINEDAAILKQDLKEVFAEAKADGYDLKVLKRLIKLRAADPAKAEELAAILELYAAEVGQRELPRLFV
jgi:uncharacterized protein (UPF0335 family)